MPDDKVPKPDGPPRIIQSGAVRDPKPGFADHWQINQLLCVAERTGLI